MQKLTIIVTGFIGLYPTGGVTWDYIQYVLGFKRLGHDVYYIEDTGQYSTYRVTERAWDDPYDTVTYLETTMDAFGLSNRWAYRDTYSKNCYGLSEQVVLDICRRADVFINISASAILRPEYGKIPVRVLIDSDPMFTQLQSNTDEPAPGDPAYATTPFTFGDYNRYFTFGENIGKPFCLIPLLDLKWCPTRQPVCLDYWKTKMKKERPDVFTTVMNWSVRDKLKYDGQEWGQKDVEFLKFINTPHLYDRSEFQVNLAVSAKLKKQLDVNMIERAGWRILNPSETISTADDYRNFIQSSAAEFSVAKETYVKSNSGWFSCRSACYLAAGKPVVTQETGWSGNIPAGEGLFSFQDQQSALVAIEELTANYKTHCMRAEEIAEEYFDSDKVLNQLIAKL